MTGPRALAAILLLSCAPVGAQIVPESGGDLRDRVRVDPRLWIVPSAVPLAEAPALAPRSSPSEPDRREGTTAS